MKTETNFSDSDLRDPGFSSRLGKSLKATGRGETKNAKLRHFNYSPQITLSACHHSVIPNTVF